MNICVFCSSSKLLAPKYVEAAHKVGRLIGEGGDSLVFGGFDAGTMGTVAHAAKDAGAAVLGAIVGRRGEYPAVVFDCDELFEASSLPERKVWMEKRSDAFVVLPGSYGTLDEFYDVVAEQKMLGTRKPVALVNVDGYWDALAGMDERMVADGFMGANCRELYTVACSPEEALACVRAPRREVR